MSIESILKKWNNLIADIPNIDLSDTFNNQFAESLQKNKSILNNNPDKIFGLVPSFFSESEPQEISNTLWNDFFSFIDRYGFSGSEDFTNEMNDYINSNENRIKALSLVNDISNYFDNRLYFSVSADKRNNLMEHYINQCYETEDSYRQSLSIDSNFYPSVKLADEINVFINETNDTVPKAMRKGQYNEIRTILDNYMDSIMSEDTEYLSSDILNDYNRLLLVLDIVENHQPKTSYELQEVYNKLSEGRFVSNEEIYKCPEIAYAKSCISGALPTYLLPDDTLDERTENILEMYYSKYNTIIENREDLLYNKEVDIKPRLDIVIGLPASGKSSVIVNNLKNEYGSMVIDNDDVKELIPEFNNGKGAGVVHKESKDIANTIFHAAIYDKKNIILPKVGSSQSGLLNYILEAKSNNYIINLHSVEISREQSILRLLKRYETDGRFLSPGLIDEYSPYGQESKIIKTYNNLKESEYIDGYSYWSNDVPFGESPILIEHSNLDGNYLHQINQAMEVNNEQQGKQQHSSRSSTDLQRSRTSGRETDEIHTRTLEGISNLETNKSKGILSQNQTEFQNLKDDSHLSTSGRLAYIKCEWSEDSHFTENTIYSISEFDELMKKANEEKAALKKAALDYYGSEEAFYEAFNESSDIKYIEALGYNKVKFEIHVGDNTYIERQDVGDDLGGLIDFLKQYEQYNDIVKILENTIKIENSMKQLVQPSTKQIKYANSIAKKLNIDLPEELSKEAYSKFISDNQLALKKLQSTDSNITYEEAMQKVSKNGASLKEIPVEHFTADLLNAAVSNWGAAIRYIPKEYMTEELAKTSVTQYGPNLKLVPEELKTAEICTIACVTSLGKSLRYTPNELKDKVKEDYKELLAKDNSLYELNVNVEQIALEEQCEQWMSEIDNMLREHESDPDDMFQDVLFASQFPNYSVKNQQLFRMQNEGVTFVASASEFKKAGYNIKPEEKALSARVPIIAHYVVIDGKKIYRANYTTEIKQQIKAKKLEEKSATRGFKFKAAFYDISQTDCPPSDYPFRYHVGFSSETHDQVYNALKEFAESLGFTVVKEDVSSIALRGDYSPSHKLIRINDKLESTQAASTLCHELGHAILHSEANNYSTAQKECEADMCSIMLMSSLGLPIADSRRSHLYHAFQDYKEEQAAKAKPYNVTLESVIDRVQSKVFRKYATKLDYYLNKHIPQADGISILKYRSLTDSMSKIAAVYDYDFTSTIEQNTLFIDKEAYTNLYQEQLTAHKNSHVLESRIAILEKGSNDLELNIKDVFLNQQELIDAIKRTTSIDKNALATLGNCHVGDVIAIKDDITTPSSLFEITENGLEQLNETLQAEVERKINCALTYPKEYESISNLLSHEIDLPDHIEAYYRKLCKTYNYKDVSIPSTEIQLMAELNSFSQDLSFEEKLLINEYVQKTGNLEEAEKLSEQLKKDPEYGKHIKSVIELVDEYTPIINEIGKYETEHSVNPIKRLTIGDSTSKFTLSERVTSLKLLDDAHDLIKRYVYPETKCYTITEDIQENYNIQYISLHDYDISLEKSIKSFNSYHDAYAYYIDEIASHNNAIMIANNASKNELISKTEELNVLPEREKRNTLADEKLKYIGTSTNVSDAVAVSLIKTSLGREERVTDTPESFRKINILNDISKTINTYGKEHFVEMCNLQDITNRKDIKNLGNWVRNKTAEIYPCEINEQRKSYISKMLENASNNELHLYDVENALNAVDEEVLELEYSSHPFQENTVYQDAIVSLHEYGIDNMYSAKDNSKAIIIYDSNSDEFKTADTMTIYDFTSKLDSLKNEPEYELTYVMILNTDAGPIELINDYNNKKTDNVLQNIVDKTKDPIIASSIKKQYYQDQIDANKDHHIRPIFNQVYDGAEFDLDRLNEIIVQNKELQNYIDEIDLDSLDMSNLKNPKKLQEIQQQQQQNRMKKQQEQTMMEMF